MENLFLQWATDNGFIGLAMFGIGYFAWTNHKKMMSFLTNGFSKKLDDIIDKLDDKK